MHPSGSRRHAMWRVVTAAVTENGHNAREPRAPTDEDEALKVMTGELLDVGRGDQPRRPVVPGGDAREDAARNVGARAVAVRAAVTELVQQHGSSLVVDGDCMAPRIRDGERVGLVPVSRPFPGDIVAVRDSSGRILVHRCVAYRPLATWREWAIVTQADTVSSTTAVDVPTRVSEVLGRVVSVEGRVVHISLRERFDALIRSCRLVGSALWRRLGGSRGVRS